VVGGELGVGRRKRMLRRSDSRMKVLGVGRSKRTEVVVEEVGKGCRKLRISCSPGR